MPHMNKPRGRDGRSAFCLTIKQLMPFASGFFGIVSLLSLVCEPLHAEEGTLAQRRACEPDVFRLCDQFIPYAEAITSCLEHNKARLSPDCRAVFQGDESADAGAPRSSPRNRSNLASTHKAAAK